MQELCQLKKRENLVHVQKGGALAPLPSQVAQKDRLFVQPLL